MKAQTLISLKFLTGKGRERKSIGSTVTLISLLGVILGVMVPIVVLSVMMGFQEEIKAKILGVKGHITVTASSISPHIINYPQVVKKIKAMDGVVSVNPYVEVQGMIQFFSGFEPVLIRGIPPSYFEEDEEVDKIFQLVDGEKKLDRRYELIMGYNLASKRLVSVGDRINLLISDQENLTLQTRPRTVETIIKGTFKTGFQEFDNGIIYVSLSTFNKVFRKKNVVKRIDIKVEDIWELDPLIEELTQAYGNEYKFFTWQEINYNFFKALALERSLMYFIVSLILVVAIFNVTSSQLIFIIERKKEIGILKTIGMKPIHIAQIFILQGSIITSIGAVIGGVLGYFISLDVMSVIKVVEFLIDIILHFIYYIKVIFVAAPSYQAFEIFPKGVYYLDYIPSDISFLRTLFFIIMAMLFSFLIGFFPSIKAARLKPLDVMRYE